MLVPKRAKYRFQFEGTNKGLAHRGAALEFGEFGLNVIQSGYLSSAQIEAARRAMTRYTKRGGRIWIRVFPSKPITKKPAETRMGSGKGPVDKYVAAVKAGKIVFEMAGITKDTALEAIRLASHKLPLKAIIISEEAHEA